VLVKVWAEHGLGECCPSAPAAGIHHIVVNLEDQLLDEDPRNVEKLYEKMRRWNIFIGEHGFDAIKLDVDDVTGPLHRDFWSGAIGPKEHAAMVVRDRISAISGRPGHRGRHRDARALRPAFGYPLRPRASSRQGRPPILRPELTKRPEDR